MGSSGHRLRRIVASLLRRSILATALAMTTRARPVTLRVTNAPGSGLNEIGLMPPSMTCQNAGRA